MVANKYTHRSNMSKVTLMTEWSLITDNKNPSWLLSDHVDTGLHIVLLIFIPLLR